MQRCNHCGSNVTDRFAKVLSNNEGEIYACQNCSPNSGIVQTARSRERELKKEKTEEKVEKDEEEKFSGYKDLSYLK